jgi:leucyl aminopeptidase
MNDVLVTKTKRPTIPIIPLRASDFNDWCSQQNETTKNWLKTSSYTPKPGTYVIIPDKQGNVKQVLLTVASEDDFWEFGSLPLTLPQAVYHVEADWSNEQLQRAVIAWGLGAYQFTRYKKQSEAAAQLFVGANKIDFGYVKNTVAAVCWVRDLINLPAEDMTPLALSEAAVKLAKEFGAKIKVISGENLIKKGLRAIHAVGRASVNPPCLLDLRWGKPTAPKVTLVGKGVCFDSGGLDLKPSNSMLTMKKDMAGAAHVLALAKMIMTAKLPVCLRVIVPAAENMIAGNSLKPGDVITTYQGTTVEVTNTDAEGRLLLADALALASEESPELIIDYASLTGAARVAVGHEIAALFANETKIANEILALAEQEDDPCCRLPIYEPYKVGLQSKIADLKNSELSSNGGAITAALFLQEFVAKGIPWVHFDIMAFNTRYRPGRPEGGEAQALRTVFCYLLKKFGVNYDTSN